MKTTRRIAFKRERMLSTAGHYLLAAWRHSLGSKAHTAINVIGFAIGMACCLVILLYVRDELSYDRHNTRGDRIYRIATDQTARTPGALGTLIEEQLPQVQEVLRLRGTIGQWLFATETRRFYEQQVYWADGNLFDVFDVPLVRGNPATALTAPNTMVISASMARKYFGEENPIGKVITGDNMFPFTITAVMEDPAPYAHYHPDFYISMATESARGDPLGLLTSWTGRNWFYTYLLLPAGTVPGPTEGWLGRLFKTVYVYLRLPTGAPSADEIEAQLQARLEEHLPAEIRSIALPEPYRLQPLYDIHLYSNLEHEMESNGNVTFIWMLMAIAVFILLIACMNFTNLAIVRTITRAREIALRKAVGATREQIVRQFMGETILFCGIVFFIALGILWAILPVFRSMTGYALSMPSLEPWSVLGGIGIIFIVGVLAGGYPALLLSRIAPATVFGGASKTADAVALRRTLVVVQFSIAIALMIGTGVVYQQLGFMRDRHPGFEKEHVVVFPEIEGMDFNLVINRIPQQAGVTSVTSANYIPGRAAGRGRLQFIPVGRGDDPEAQPEQMQMVATTGGYVSTLGLRLLGGRDVSFERDLRMIPQPDGSVQSVIDGCLLNEEAARRLGWSSPEEAIDRFVGIAGMQIRVVGVVEDFHLKSLRDPIEPLLITVPGSGIVAIRLEPGNPTETLRNLEGLWKKSTPDIPFTYTFLEDDVDRLYRSDRLQGRVVTLFAALAVFTACLGLFGLAVFTTRQRTREVGIRKTLGAPVGRLILLLSKETTVLVAIANIIAWPVAYVFMQRWLQDFAYHTDISLLLFPAAGLLGLLIAWITVSSQTLRAAGTDPVETLRAG